ncbi:MAG TPA: GNAT family N-acetyltransferase [Paracoccaceae bacterium]|nr:GNAT family N-acetyltransferase [Paracoccaceae bacterium]
MMVRPMEPRDREEVRAMLADLYGSPVEEPEKEGDILVAAEAGALAGCIAIAVRPWADGCETAPVPYVEAWYVAPAFRRRGIGRALMRAAEHWARERGFTELGSDALLDNAASLAAHAALGFLPTQKVQFFRKIISREEER